MGLKFGHREHANQSAFGMDLFKQPLTRRFAVAAAIQKYHCGDASLEDVEKQERIFFVHRAGTLLPLTFDYQIISKLFTIDYKEITLARSLID